MQNKKEAKRILPQTSFFPKNQKGQGLSTNAIILIILGVVILVVLILGFTIGWEKIAPWLGGGDNVDTVVSACTSACATTSTYNFCTKPRELKFSGTIAGLTSGTEYDCNDLVGKQGLGVDACPAITCPSTETEPESTE